MPAYSGPATTLPSVCYQVRVTVTYSLHGLVVRSAVALAAPCVGDREADLQISVGEERSVGDEPPPGRELAGLEIGGRKLYTIAIEGGLSTIRFHGLCDIDVSAAFDELVAHPVPGTEPEMVALLAGGTGIAFALRMKGVCVLHASAVDVDGRALAFVGASGAGKSTLATLLCAGGAGLLTDDVLRVDRDGDGYQCHPGTTDARLRPSAAELADGFTDRPGRPTADQRTALSFDAALEPRALAAIVLPRPSHEAIRLRVERLSARDALLHLLAVPRVAGWRDPDVLRSLFHHAADLATKVPVFDAEIPWGPPFPPSLGESLLRETEVT